MPADGLAWPARRVASPPCAAACRTHGRPRGLGVSEAAQRDSEGGRGDHRPDRTIPSPPTPSLPTNDLHTTAADPRAAADAVVAATAAKAGHHGHAAAAAGPRAVAAGPAARVAA